MRTRNDETLQLSLLLSMARAQPDSPRGNALIAQQVRVMAARAGERVLVEACDAAAHERAEQQLEQEASSEQDSDASDSSDSDSQQSASDDEQSEDESLHTSELDEVAQLGSLPPLPGTDSPLDSSQQHSPANGLQPWNAPQQANGLHVDHESDSDSDASSSTDFAYENGDLSPFTPTSALEIPGPPPMRRASPQAPFRVTSARPREECTSEHDSPLHAYDSKRQRHM